MLHPKFPPELSSPRWNIRDNLSSEAWRRRSLVASQEISGRLKALVLLICSQWSVGEEAEAHIDHVLSDSCSLLSLAEEVCGALMGSFESPGYK